MSQKQKQKTVLEIIEEVKSSMCFGYCKHPEECIKKASGDEGVADEMMLAICDKCPLQKL